MFMQMNVFLAWKKMASPLELEKFHYQEFEVPGSFVNDIMFKGKGRMPFVFLLQDSLSLRF